MALLNSRLRTELGLLETILQWIKHEKEEGIKYPTLSPSFDEQGRLHIVADDCLGGNPDYQGEYVITVRLEGGQRVIWGSAEEDVLAHSWSETRNFLNSLLQAYKDEEDLREAEEVISCGYCCKQHPRGDSCYA